MIRPLVMCALAWALAAPLAAQARAHPHRTAPSRPVLVELFTAQGCEGCPQADLALGELAKKRGVVALSFSVDVWDYTGWTDTFAQPEFTERQKTYVKRFNLRELYTPEVVIGGLAQTDGLQKPTVNTLIAKAQRVETGKGPSVRLDGDGGWVQIGAARSAGVSADVWLMRYDPKPAPVKVKLGDNKGKTVVVTNAVRELVKLGAWRGKAKRFDLPDPAAEGLNTVVVVQAPHGGPVLAIGRD